MSAEMPKPDHNKALAVAILKTPAVDRDGREGVRTMTAAPVVRWAIKEKK